MSHHVPPKYHGYQADSYDSVGRCLKCNRISLYEDFHPANPCPGCGAESYNREWVSAKWVWSSPWWHMFWRKGYWEKAQ